jgi:hypothetical protein
MKPDIERGWGLTWTYGQLNPMLYCVLGLDPTLVLLYLLHYSTENGMSTRARHALSVVASEPFAHGDFDRGT